MVGRRWVVGSARAKHWGGKMGERGGGKGEGDGGRREGREREDDGQGAMARKGKGGKVTRTDAVDDGHEACADGLEDGFDLWTR